MSEAPPCLPLQGSVSINDVIELPALKQTRPVKSMQVRGQERGEGRGGAGAEVARARTRCCVEGVVHLVLGTAFVMLLCSLPGG